MYFIDKTDSVTYWDRFIVYTALQVEVMESGAKFCITPGKFEEYLIEAVIQKLARSQLGAWLVTPKDPCKSVSGLGGALKLQFFKLSFICGDNLIHNANHLPPTPPASHH